MRILLYFLSIAVVALLTPTFVHAHAIGVDCKVRGGKVEVEVYYDDDSPAARAKIEVVATQDKDRSIARGVADEKGKWSFALPAPGSYEVRVDGGAGHRAKKSITIPAVNTPGNEVGTIGKTGLPAGSRPADSEKFQISINNEPSESPREATISEGASREEFTSIPWLKIAIGLVVIGACAGAFLVSTMVRRQGV